MSQTTRLPRIVTASALAGAMLGALSGSPVHADGETCDGKPATIVVSSDPGATVDGTTGDDVIVVTFHGPLTVDGLDGADTICGLHATRIQGGPGDDDLWSGGVMLGGSGDDVLQGDDRRNVLFGGDGNDTIYGGGSDDYLAGDDGGDPSNTVPIRDDDYLDAGTGDDTVLEDWGDDTFIGGDGADTFTLGIDEADLPDDPCQTGLTAEPVLDVRAGTVTGLGNDTIGGFEAYVGGPYDETMLGSSAPEVFTTSECGTNVINGRGGADDLTGKSGGGGELRGGVGDDHIKLSSSYDVHAGAGSDVVRLATNGYHAFATRHSTLHGGAGVDEVDNATYYDGIDLRTGLVNHGHVKVPVAGFENARLVHGYTFDRTTRLIGTSGPNVLVAEPALPGDVELHTVLWGLGGNDRLLAGRLDTAHGGPGHDFCRAQHRVECEAH